MVSKGLTNKEIGLQLNISYDTVRAQCLQHLLPRVSGQSFAPARIAAQSNPDFFILDDFCSRPGSSFKNVCATRQKVSILLDSMTVCRTVGLLPFGMGLPRMIGGIMTLLAPGLCSGLLSAQAQPVSNQTQFVELKLDDYLQSVRRQNESVQAQMLEVEVNRRKAKGEKGIFEPELVTSILREADKRTNNVQQQASQGGQLYFDERNTIYDGGIESLIPTGGKVRLGATMSDLVNNINPIPIFGSVSNKFTQEYQAFVGVTFTQPLLKNGGFAPTLAGIRIAALYSDLAFQEYRRQLMLTMFQAEAAYWNVYFAQEQVQFFDESVSVAGIILNDTEEKLKAGQGAELDVMEAQSGLALRKTKQNDALQNYYDAMGRLQMLTGTYPAANAPTVRVVDIPLATNAPLSYPASFERAFYSNPDYLIQCTKVDEEKVRLGVAKNQLLPELNFKAAYGFNGLGKNASDAWSVADSTDFPAWSVGVELHIPLAGNIKGRNFISAAKLSLQESLVNLNGVQTQIANGLHTSIQKALGWCQSIQSYQTVVHYNEDLLKTQLQRLDVGRVEARKVLEVEADLLDSRQELANALVQYQRALLEVELAEGSLLKNHQLDVTKDELRRQTMALLNSHHLPLGEFMPILPKTHGD